MADANPTKICTACNEAKPFSEFYPHKLCLDGLRSTCKECGKRATKEYRQTERGRELHYQEGIRYRKTKGGRAVFYKGWLKYAKKHPEKIRAVKFVDGQVRAGKLQRPIVCSKCGATGVAIEAHHWNGYEREHWLDILWLCVPCHKLCHKLLSQKTQVVDNT